MVRRAGGDLRHGPSGGNRRGQATLPRWHPPGSWRRGLRDGSAWNYGKFDDPARPEYSYRREVDYVSGAALMVPRDLFWKSAGSTSTTSPPTTRTWTSPRGPGGGSIGRLPAVVANRARRGGDVRH